MATVGVVFIASLPSTIAEAATINQVNPATLTGTALITFDDVVGGLSPGTTYDTIFESGGANFGERFVGQTLTFDGTFDTLSGTPTNPLALQAGNPGENLAVYVDPTTPANTTNVLTGRTPVGAGTDTYAEGSFAVLFDFDQSEFGFDLVGGGGGSATVNFFTRNGSLLSTIVLETASTLNVPYAFRRDGGIRDIAGISIHNNDPQGVNFENLRSDVPGVPGVPTNPSPPTEIPFEFSPNLGLLILGAWAAIGMLKTKVQKRKVLEVGSVKTNDGQPESV